MTLRSYVLSIFIALFAALGTSVQDIGTPRRTDDILRNSSTRRKQFNQENDDPNQNQGTSLHRKAFIYIIVFIVILTVIGTVIGVSLHIIKREELPTSKPTETNPTDTTETTETSTSSSTSSTTITEPTVLFESISRSGWEARPMSGKKAQKPPIERLIVMDTQTAECNDIETCKAFVKKRQMDNYNDLELGSITIDDICENFLISPDGNIFEGRGFSKEGQHSFDRSKTSYNNQAIGVSFIGNYTEQDIESSQNESLIYFTQKWIEEDLLVPDYKLYYKYQLTESRQTYDKLYETVKTMNHWTDGK